MKKILFLYLISLGAFAQVTILTDVTKSFAEVPSEAEARSALLTEAALEAAKKIAPEMGFVAEDFEKKLNAKFAEHFELYQKKKLKEKFGAGANALNEAQKKEFLASLDSDRPSEFVKFTRAKENVRSYNFKQSGADENDPKMWNAKIELMLDKNKLLRMYRRIMSNEKRPYAKLLLHPTITHSNMAWSDLGLENAESFAAPVITTWIKWLEEHLPPSVDEAQLCQKECLEFWNSWTETPQDQMLTRVPMEYMDSVWLNIDLNMRRTEYSSELSQLGMEWEGRVVLLDVNTKRIIATFEIPTEQKVFRGQNQQAINSGLASAIYRSPFGAFVQISKALGEKVGLNRLSRLVIKGHRHLGDAMALVEKLKTRGASLGLEVGLHSFSKDEAHLICFYRGEEKSFSDLLSALKELKSSQSYTLVNDFTGVHHVLKLVAE